MLPPPPLLPSPSAFRFCAAGLALPALPLTGLPLAAAPTFGLEVPLPPPAGFARGFAGDLKVLKLLQVQVVSEAPRLPEQLSDARWNPSSTMQAGCRCILSRDHWHSSAACSTCVLWHDAPLDNKVSAEPIRCKLQRKKSNISQRSKSYFAGRWEARAPFCSSTYASASSLSNSPYCTSLHSAHWQKGVVAHGPVLCLPFNPVSHAS